MDDATTAECAAIVRELLEESNASKGAASTMQAGLTRLVRVLGRADHSGDLEARVRVWLGAQGFPLEFRVARAFAARGFTVTPSHYVEVDGAAREIDVLAVKSQHTMNARSELQFYVECKWSRSHPWIVFHDTATTNQVSPLWKTIPHNGMGEGVLWCLAESQRLCSLAPIAAAGVEGYGGRQALTTRKPDDPDAFYSALQSVTAITRAGVKDRSSLDASQSRDVRLAFPVVVIDAPLFAVSLPVGVTELQLEQVPRARVHWRAASAEISSLVDVVTMDGLDDFIRHSLDGMNDALNLITTVHFEVVEALAKDSPKPIEHWFRNRIISPPILLPDVLRKLAIKYAAERETGS